MFFRREFLDRMKMTSDSFFINFEVAFGIMKLTKRAAYVNIEAEQRRSGRSKVTGYKRIVQVLKEMIRYRLSF
ncbi:MAG: hypothetical protein FJ088_02695 [Deltaproteobacteria bacterium]|nr:hypothetical protein [Deltaproteobacteria bacterium]